MPLRRAASDGRAGPALARRTAPSCMGLRRRSMRWLRTLVACLAFAAASTALAQTPITLTVSGNQALGTISLPGGISADVAITFESVVGLTPEALNVTVTLVNPLDPALL